MGSKRVGLARTQALIENLKRSLDLSSSELKNAAVDGATSLSTGVQTVAAAGTNVGSATAITATTPLVLVTGANGSAGVKLPALSDVSTGTVLIIANTAAAALKVYPASGDQVLPLGDDTAFTLAASSTAICVSADNTKWIGLEGTVIG